MSRLFARRRGLHCRHGSLTGWSALAFLVGLEPVVESFTRPRTSTPHIHPYDSPKDAA
ncbi:hypothetical protein [Nonomuraea phyllanthi]|uniref:hypothetical protein n=1 Tax=Nonomuraea phyllanthi TaxID=2219224 RepID=UPI00186AEA0E|nr:hypothetical protein [Nonomuraea phyllanthi]